MKFVIPQNNINAKPQGLNGNMPSRRDSIDSAVMHHTTVYLQTTRGEGQQQYHRRAAKICRQIK